jgi:uncharacterized delta-60 repeat protein
MVFPKLISQYTMLLAILSFLAFNSFAQTISLDPAFDQDGIVVTDFGTEEDICRDMALQSDGKIVVAGYTDDGVFSLVRYNANGSLDNTFDDDGKVTTQVGTSGGRAHTVAIQNDGKILAAGYGYNGIDNDFAVVRYNPDGSLDASFGLDGIAMTNFGQFSNDRAFDMIIQTDEKILLCGYNTDPDNDREFAMVRYNSDGSIDNSFNTTGMVSTIIQVGDDEAHSVLIQEDGKIILAGFSFDFSVRNFTVVRYNSDGTIDNTFDGDGIVTTSITSYDDAAYAAALQSDGKIVLVGYTSGETYDFALMRYNTDGSLDNTFGTGGIVITPIGNSADLAYSIIIQEDNKILVGGQADFNDTAFALLRYNPDGSLDTSFDSDGIVTTQIGPIWSEDLAFSMLLQPDGNIVLGGQTSDSDNTDYDFALTRYINSGNIGIEEFNMEIATIAVFPNPAHSSATIHCDIELKSATVSIFNSSGNNVSTLTNVHRNHFSLNCEYLPSGIYYIQIHQENGTIFNESFSVIH